MKINPRTITYVTAVAEEKSFSKAAEKLFITQPSLSQHILNAEKEYGVSFFNRKTNPLSLTYAGERFLAIAREMECLDEQLTREMEDIAGNASGRIVVGCSPTRGSWFIPELFHEFRVKYPRTELVLREGSNAELLEDVKYGRADFAFVGYSDPALTSLLISERPFMLAVPKNGDMVSQLEAEGEIDIAKLKKMPFILLCKGQSIRKMADRLFEQANMSPVIAHETRSYQMAVQMADAGLGCTFVVGYDQYPMRNCVLYSIRGIKDSYRLLLVYRADHYLSAAMRYFVERSQKLDPLQSFGL